MPREQVHPYLYGMRSSWRPGWGGGGVGRGGGKASRPGFFLGVISPRACSYAQLRGTWQIAPCLDVRTNRFSPTRVGGEGPLRWLVAPFPVARWSALTTSLLPRLTSTEKDSPRRPPAGAGDLGGGRGLALEQSCPQAAGQRVPGGRRRRSGGARRVREVWAAVRPQLPPGPAAEPIATTRRRRQLPLPTPNPARGGLTLPFPCPSRSGCGPGDWQLGSRVIQAEGSARSCGGGGPESGLRSSECPRGLMTLPGPRSGGQPQQAAGGGPAQLGPPALSVVSVICPVTKETTSHYLVPYTPLPHPSRFSAALSVLLSLLPTSQGQQE